MMSITVPKKIRKCHFWSCQLIAFLLSTKYSSTYYSRVTLSHNFYLGSLSKVCQPHCPLFTTNTVDTFFTFIIIRFNMKITLLSMAMFASTLQLSVDATNTNTHSKGIRGAAKQPEEDVWVPGSVSVPDQRQLKKSKSISEKGGGGDSGKSSKTKTNNNNGDAGPLSNYVNMATGRNGQTFALLDTERYASATSSSRTNANSNGSSGLIEHHQCISHERALEFNKWYKAENTENDATCVSNPDSCGGCCRVGYALWCDSKNGFPFLPCICNSRTRDPASWQTPVLNTTDAIAEVVESELVSNAPEATYSPEEEDGDDDEDEDMSEEEDVEVELTVAPTI